MITELLVQAVLTLFDPGFWVMVARLLAREDERNKDLLTWERTGL